MSWLLSTSAIAQLKLPALIADSMVLQRNTKISLWGWDKPNIKLLITPSWGNKSYTITTNKDGEWLVSVPTGEAGGPYRIDFNDGQTTTINNILLGDVWLCSGQSNMVMPLKGYDKGQNVLHSDSIIAAASNYPNIRVFDVAKKIAVTPASDVKGSWITANPQSAPQFSAVAYTFATQLADSLHIPIGVITSCWGSTAVQSWMGATVLNEFKEITLCTRLDTMKVPANNPEELTSGLFNGMIKPLTPYQLKGFLWYQGESNKDAALYAKLLPAMIENWRKEWANARLPFYYVQITPWSYTDRNTAFLREAQLNAHIPHSAMVVTLDAGQEHRIHPADKLLIGNRLAALVLGQTYKFNNMETDYPVMQHTSFRGQTAIVVFKNAYKGLHLNSPTGFELAGSDGVFHPAQATVKGKNQVIVSCVQVKAGVALRYAFKNWTEASLYNSAGLPASSFRTDQFTQ